MLYYCVCVSFPHTFKTYQKYWKAIIIFEKSIYSKHYIYKRPGSNIWKLYLYVFLSCSIIKWNRFLYNLICHLGKKRACTHVEYQLYYLKMLTFVPFDCLKIKIKTFSLNVYSQIGSLKILRFQSKLSNFFIILLSKKKLSIILISGFFLYIM